VWQGCIDEYAPRTNCIITVADHHQYEMRVAGYRLNTSVRPGSSTLLRLTPKMRIKLAAASTSTICNDVSARP
jgi:hypothetical protein